MQRNNSFSKFLTISTQQLFKLKKVWKMTIKSYNMLSLQILLHGNETWTTDAKYVKITLCDNMNCAR